jgi:hypothetical protein
MELIINEIFIYLYRRMEGGKEGGKGGGGLSFF